MTAVEDAVISSMIDAAAGFLAPLPQQSPP
jgi:hypothetical protein